MRTNLLHSFSFFLPTFSFPLFLHFCFSFFFSILLSHHFLLIFSSLFDHFLFLFGATTHPVKGRKLPPHFLNLKVWLSLFHIFLLFFLNLHYDIIPTWLNMSHGIKSHAWLIVSHGIHATHVAQCEPFLFIPSVTLLRCHVASPNLAMCHPTPHASTNVKSRPPRNSTKFDVVAKFHETISTEKSVSSSEI